VAELGEDFLLDIPLRADAAVNLDLRQMRADDRDRAEHVVDELLDQRLVELVQGQRHGCAAQFEIALRRCAAEDEDAFDAVDVLDVLVDFVGRLVGVVERRIRRQFDGENDARRIFRRQEAARNLHQAA
jgi:hypothetical protein